MKDALLTKNLSLSLQLCLFGRVLLGQLPSSNYRRSLRPAFRCVILNSKVSLCSLTRLCSCVRYGLEAATRLMDQTLYIVARLAPAS